MNKYGYEQVQNAETPEQMRAELNRLKRHDPLVRAVFDMADYSGLSAEDRFTVLAYHAMKEKNRAMETALEFANRSPSANFFMPEELKK